MYLWARCWAFKNYMKTQKSGQIVHGGFLRILLHTDLFNAAGMFSSVKG